MNCSRTSRKKCRFTSSTKFWASVLLSSSSGWFWSLVFYKTVIQDTMTDKEVAESIQIVWHDSIWVDKKVRPDEATIVPAFTFKIKNTGRRPLQYVGFNCIFIFEDSGENLTDGYVEAVKKPLPARPGQRRDLRQGLLRLPGDVQAGLHQEHGQLEERQGEDLRQDQEFGPGPAGSIPHPEKDRRHQGHLPEGPESGK